ncbi:hydrolase of the alpha beta superfamily [Fusarium agapanthi]|uniref:Hydrolase of the alpha beta superfamily n=1 Tax=Fusarium agapanthi TaxID=1803897 RepID=A0A9P5BK19_9HYPO|nr:hydrolase of the alpha beta superfamily [Fusarium agapanthi]
MKSILNYAAQGIMVLAVTMPVSAQNLSYGADNFYRSESVTIQPIHFNTVYNTTIVGNLFTARNTSRSTNFPAIVVGHPMGAVKEQSANLYATKLAEQGFITLTLDLPLWGRSDGPQNLVSPDFYTEAYSAAVDHLGTYNFVDRDRIGALGICGSGSFVINAAKIDARIQAVATVSMYDMGTVNRQGLRGAVSVEQRRAAIANASQRRWAEIDGAPTAYTGGTPNKLTSQTDAVSREFFDFYRTVRGEFTPEGWQRNQTTRPTLVSNVNFLNFYPFNDIKIISPRPLLIISGDQSHSREFSENAYRAAGEPKQLYWVFMIVLSLFLSLSSATSSKKTSFKAFVN